MEQFGFSVGTADSASSEVASGTGVLNNASASPRDELELTLGFDSTQHGVGRRAVSSEPSQFCIDVILGPRT